MKQLLGLVGVVALGLLACTGSNPASCADGTCSDPQKAYCDVDGSFSGTPGLCVHVDCTPGEFASCHGGKALVCNAQGNSYESNTCANGQCDEGAGGCVGCTANDQCSLPRGVCDLGPHQCVECLQSSQCAAPQPVCDVPARECVECTMNSDCMPPRGVCNVTAKQCAVGCTVSSQCPTTEPFCDAGMMLCRRCERDSECTSDLCEVTTGQCVAETDITYAAPNGSTGTCGTKAAPCSLATAWSHMDATHHVIKLAAGTYATTAPLTIPNTQVTVYGYGATVTTASGGTFQLSGPASLRFDGVKFIHADAANYLLYGVGSGAATCSIKLNSVNVEAATSVQLNGCSMTVDRSSFLWPALTGDPGISMTTNSELTASRTVFRNAGIRTNNARIHISNSLFRDTRYSAVGVSNPNGGTSDISFTTFLNSPLGQTLPTPDNVTVSNCILMGAPLGGDAISGNAFSVHYSMLNPQAAAPNGSDHILLNMDPKFINSTAGDFHLQVGSPAIDAADPLSTLADDFDGAKRPVGNARDLGAFEKQ